MKGKTQIGLLLLIIGLTLGAIYTVIYSSIFFIAENVNFNSPFLSIISGISGIGSLIIIVGAILFFLGRKEFGEKHHKNVNKALYLFLISIVVTIVLTVLISFYVYSSIISGSSIDSTLFSALIMIILVVSAILGGLIYYYALIELIDDKRKNILYIAIAVSIIISIIGSVYISGFIENVFGSINDPAYELSSVNYLQNMGGIGIISVIPSILYIYVLYIPYSRIKKGELIPQTQPSYTNNYPNRICPYCRKPIPNDSIICPYCGKKLEW